MVFTGGTEADTVVYSNGETVRSFLLSSKMMQKSLSYMYVVLALLLKKRMTSSSSKNR